MKHFWLFIMIFFATHAFASNKSITIHLKDVTVRVALEALEKEAGISFWFNTQDVDMEKIISVNLRDESLEEALGIILNGQQVCYEFKSDHIIIARKRNFGMKDQRQGSTVSKIISGTVVDESDQPLGNVTVSVLNGDEQTVSDSQGRFSFAVPVATKQLSFSFVGMKSLDMPAKNNMEVKMFRKDHEMPEFVVTALDIMRNKKSLPYSSQSIGEDEISKNRELNFASGLGSIVPGISVLPSESGFGGSTKIVLRGTKNITSTNQPLFVIDGMPIPNTQTSDPYGFYSGRDSGDGLSNINPDEIQSITILKGANAAALYGSQGSNGVILITTKKGSAGKTSITINSSVTMTTVSEYFPLQYRYGQTSSGAEDSWGVAGSYSDVQKDFFKKGATFQNTISMSGGNERMRTYFAYANANASGVVPTNHYRKDNLSFRQTSSFLDNRLSFSSNLMLTLEKLHNTFLNGYYWNPLLGLYNFPRGLDFSYYKKSYEVLDPDRNIMSQNWPVQGNAEAQMNPYWILNNDPDDTKTQRIMVNVALDYKLGHGLTLSARGNYDYTTQLYEMKARATSSPVLVSQNGRYIYSNLASWQAYGDVLLTFDKQLLDDFDVHAVAGAAYQKKIIGDGLVIDSQTYGLTFVNNFTIQNIASLLAFANSQQIGSRIIKESAFGNLSVGYKGKIYLDVSGRNDWASSLAFTNNVPYFYPSVGVSLIANEIMRLPKAINFAKLRASFAQVSNEIPSFITNPTGSVSANGYTGSFMKAFTNLKPEMSANFEAGLDMNLFSNRLSIDFTCYQIDNRSQYLVLQAPSGSGYTSYYVNAGYVRGKGLEVLLKGSLVKTKKLVWNSSLNFGSNNNKIIRLSDELTGYYQIPGGGEGYEMKVVTGGSMGDIYAFAYSRDDKGSILLDNEHIPQKTTIEKKVGNANPRWTMGWSNRFKISRWEFSFAVDGKFGGKFISMTQAYLDRYGVTKATADARDNGGVKVSGVMADGSSWSGLVDAKTYYTGTAGRGGLVEQYVYDATNVRLRDATVGYTIDFQKKKGNFIKSLVLSLIASTPFYIYKKVPGNPNTTISTGNGTQAVENFGLPPVRSLTFNIRANI